MAETPYRRGILSEPLDLDGDAPRVRKAPPRIPAEAGLEVEVRGTPLYGVVVGCDSAIVTIRDRMGRDHKVRLRDEAFDVQGKQVTLVRPTAVSTAGASRTASGSVAVVGASARIARASRLLVEGGALDPATSDTVGLVVSNSCTFFESVAFPEVIDVGLRVERLGRSSVTYQLGVFRAGGDEAAAQGRFVHVYVTRADQRPVAIPEVVLRVLEGLRVE
jgi:acyl-CoA thioester hydrolase